MRTRRFSRLRGGRFLAGLAFVISRRIRPNGTVQSRHTDAVIILASDAAFIAVSSEIAGFAFVIFSVIAAFSVMLLMIRAGKFFPGRTAAARFTVAAAVFFRLFFIVDQ